MAGLGVPELVVILVVVGLPLLLIAVLVVVAIRLNLAARRKVAAMEQEVAASGEKVLRGPEAGLYRGSTGGFPAVKGNGVAILTEKRLVFQKSIGARIEVPLAEVTGVREDKWFAGAYRNGAPHLILQTPQGEVGFMFADHAEWLAAVQSATGHEA